MKSKKNTNDRVEKDLALLGGTSETSRLARNLLWYSHHTQWGGYMYCPLGSVLEATVREFDQKTHAPLELPLFTTLAMLSAIALKRKIRIRISGVAKPLEVFVWIMLLAESGSLKSLTMSSIAEVIEEAGEKDLFRELSGVSGPAAFMQEFAGTGETPSMNRLLFTLEEAGQFRKKMRDGGPLEELKNIFIQIYDGKQVTRITKTSKLVVENPVISLFGISVAEIFLQEVLPEDMLSGEMQRQAIILCEPYDVNARRHAIMKINLGKTRRDWKRLIQSLVHAEYTVNPRMVRFFESINKRLVEKFSKDIPDSFLLRIMWSFHRYALLYHLLLGKGHEQNISKDAYRYAERVIERILSDMARVFRLTLSSETRRKMEQVEKWIEKHHRIPTPRDIYRNFRNIRLGEAETLIRLAKDNPDISRMLNEER